MGAHAMRTSLAENKSVLAIKGLMDLPREEVFGTIDIWWMIHDGGFMILLCWMLVQHRIWRGCHLRVYTITENIGAKHAEEAGRALTNILRQRRLVDVNVEVIEADDAMLEPFNYDKKKRALKRQKSLTVQAVDSKGRTKKGLQRSKSLPVEVSELLQEAADAAEAIDGDAADVALEEQVPAAGQSAAMGIEQACRLEIKDSDGEGNKEITEEVIKESADAWRQRGAKKLNHAIHSRSKRSELVVMNMPDLWGTGLAEANSYMSYCDSLTDGLERVLFVQSSGHEIFDLQQ